MVLFRKSGTHDLFVFATRSCPNILPILWPNYGATDPSDHLTGSGDLLGVPIRREGEGVLQAGREGEREGGRV